MPFEIATVDAIDCLFVPAPWTFADERAGDIDDHWRALTAATPQLFNGRVLLQSRGGIEREPDGRAIFRGAYTDVDFKAFLAWRDFGYPVRGFRNGFGMAALESADGAFLLGEMAAHTANAGRIYFPSGTPDLGDVADGRVDLEGSVRRELAEETGIDPADVAFAPGFTVIHDAVRVCFMKRARSPQTAEALVDRIHAALAAETMPELRRMHVVRSARDLVPEMPSFVAAYLREALGGRL